MNKKIFILITIVIMFIGLFAACGQSSQIDTKLGNLDYNIVNHDTVTDSYLLSWYEENYKKEGVYSFDTDEYKYILLAAGEKPTGGYSVEITSIEGTKESIVVSGKVNAPKQDEMVITAITYPNVLVRIEKDSRPVSLGNFDNKTTQPDNKEKGAKEGNGVYVGLIDNNSVEIKIDGKPTAFRLAENVSALLQENQPQTGEEIDFIYKENEHGQLIITELLWVPTVNIGKYVGQIDNNSIEIEIDGNAGAYRLSDEAKSVIQNLNEGDFVEFNYITNEHGQFIIKSIRKINLDK